MRPDRLFDERWPVETRRRLLILRVAASCEGSITTPALTYGLSACGLRSTPAEIDRALDWLAARGLVKTARGRSDDGPPRRVALTIEGQHVERSATIAGALAEQPNPPGIEIRAELAGTAPAAAVILDAARRVCARPAAAALLGLVRDVVAGRRADQLTHDDLICLFRDAADAVAAAIPVTVRVDGREGP